jgi:hypothetical protein
VVILSTASNTLDDQSSSSFSSSKKAMLNLLGHLGSDACCEGLESWVESRSSESEITDPEGVPSGVPYIAETGDSVEALELSLLMIGGGGARVNPLSL